MQDFAPSSIVKIDKDGRQVGKITWDSRLGDLKGYVVQVGGFAIDRFGSIYVHIVMLEEKGKDANLQTPLEFLAKFKPGGQFDSATKLSPPHEFILQHFERFPSGKSW
jgi:hypothetical protein